MKIAVIGSGIAGAGCAWLLRRHHEVTLYEADDRFGGHAHTVEVAGPQGPVAVDTGFIVYNDVNYPNLVGLFDALGVETKASTMSFAVSIDEGRLEYSGGTLAGLFGQRSNLFRPRFHRMIADLLRFYREAPKLLDANDIHTTTLGAYLGSHGYSQGFIEDHILPMGAAIWSCPIAQMLEFPAASFVQFCVNHGLLKLTGRPNWRTVHGGSREYVRLLTAPLLDRARLSTPVTAIRRVAGGLEVTDATGGKGIFDQAVLACHGADAAAIVADDRPDAAAILSAFRYQPNRAVLHRDASLMPKRRRVWSSWNYAANSLSAKENASVSVTYWMNLLQSLPGSDLFVTLNPLREPKQELVERDFVYDHPIFDHAAIAAQSRLPALQGKGGLWFCGSYCGWGFHEDGLSAGLAIAAALGCEVPWRAAPIRAPDPNPSLEPALV